jgi:hypothetical protein
MKQIKLKHMPLAAIYWRLCTIACTLPCRLNQLQGVHASSIHLCKSKAGSNQVSDNLATELMITSS